MTGPKLIQLESLKATEKEIKIRSIYDLKIKVKDEELFMVVRYLTKKLMNCDINPEIHFIISNTKDLGELKSAIDRFLNPIHSRKYDDDARHILYTLKYLIQIV